VRSYEKALKAQRQLSALEKDGKDSNKLLMNELQELGFSALISFYIMLYYVETKLIKEAFALAQHTISEIENCVDFCKKSGVLDRVITNHLETTILPLVI